MKERMVLFDVSKERVADLAETLVERYDDSLLVLAPLAGKLSIHAPSERGEYKGYHRIKCEVLIPADAIKGDNILDDFGAMMLLRLPKARVQDHLKEQVENDTK